jgi:hypothetical protein
VTVSRSPLVVLIDCSIKFGPTRLYLTIDRGVRGWSLFRLTWGILCGLAGIFRPHFIADIVEALSDTTLSACMSDGIFAVSHLKG